MKVTIHHIEQELSGYYPKTEIRAFIRLIIEHVLGLDYTQQILMRDLDLHEPEKKKIRHIVERLKLNEPLQYILGETEFYNLKLKLTPGVLIPRPETEELVQWVTATITSSKTDILDIGTGSGCIALTLKKLIPEAHVTATDISEKALETAKANSKINNLHIDFIKADILKWEELSWSNYDVIVSNPPYVRESEKQFMLPNVLLYEPEEALFVPNDNPLLFYNRIAAFASHYLNAGGWLFFEINEHLGDEMTTLMENEGFHAIEIKKDLFNKNRMLRCRK